MQFGISPKRLIQATHVNASLPGQGAAEIGVFHPKRKSVFGGNISLKRPKRPKVEYWIALRKGKVQENRRRGPFHTRQKGPDLELEPFRFRG